ncbi:MAG: ABC transporter permease [Bryobacterales bacterium]
MRWRRFWNRKQRDNELGFELELHLAEEIDDNLAAGMTAEQARLAALRKLGNRTHVREDVYNMNTIGWLETFGRDARYALRGFRKSPGFTSVALLSLMLGIGATTAIFSVIYGVVIDPYPYARPHEIWAPLVQNIKTNRPNSFSAHRLSEFLEFRKLTVFADAMGTSPDSMLLTGNRSPENLSTILVTGNGFQFMGVEPVLGRVIQPSDIRPGGEAEPVAVLSYRAWQRLFDGDERALGQELVLNDQPHTVIGVMPPRFGWWTGDGVWLPLPEDVRNDRTVFPIFRLKEGISKEVAEERLHALTLRLAEQNPDNFPKEGFTTTLRNYMDITVASGTMQTSLQLLFCAVGFLLLIACANVANLQLARSTARTREIAVRLSIGAGRRRLLRQLLTESVLLSLLGGALGVLFAVGATRAIVALMPDFYVPNEARITVNIYVLLFSLIVSVLTGILFGLAPALQSSRPDLTHALKEATQGAGIGGGRRTRNALVIVEVALSMILLVGAGLTVRSFIAILAVDTGFHPERVLMVSLPLPPQRYPTLEQRNLFAQQVLDSVRNLPGVEAATVGNGGMPFGGPRSAYAIEGQPDSEERRIIVGLAGADYLQAIGIPLRLGRAITAHEVARAEPVALINEAAARLWPEGEQPLGKRLRLDVLTNHPPNWLSPEANSPYVTVVGVIGDTKNDGLRNEPLPAAVAPYTLLAPAERTLALRTRTEPTSMLNAVRERVQAIDPNQPVSRPITVEEVLGFQTVQPRFTMALFSFFGLMGLILAVAGVYSVLSYQVTQRTHEIGVRMALGARRGDVEGLMLRLGSKLIFAGLLIGIGACLALGRFFESQLFGVPATDPLSIASVALLLMVVALLSAYLPARRAARVDPLVALRHE